MSMAEASQARRPPKARGLPVLGSVFDVMRDMRAFLTEQYLELGPVFRLRLMHRRFTVLAGPQANVFANTEGSGCMRSRDAWADMIEELGVQHTVTSLDGPDHGRMREPNVRSSSRAFALEYIPEVIDIARRSISRWPIDRPIPGVHTFQRIATDQVGTVNAGFSPMEYFDDLVVFIRTIFMVRMIHLRPALMLYTPRYRRARKRVEELCRKIVKAHDPEQRGSAHPDLVDNLVALHRADARFLTERDLRVAVLGPFFATLDALGSICVLMLYALLKHPDLLERATEEADRLFADGIPDPDALRRLDVIHRVAMETLRLYPPVPSLPRTANRSFEFGGYTIPEGESLILATTLPHDLPELFPEPERFDIERYTEERMEHRQPGAFAPWGVGPHLCPGDGFAEVCIVLTVATVLHEAELALDPPNYKLRLIQGLGPRPDDELKLRVKRHRR